MDFFKTCLLVLTIGLSSSLIAQQAAGIKTSTVLPQQGFSLNGGMGTFFSGEGISADNTLSPVSIGLNYQLPLSAKLSLVTGVGVQHRRQELITASGAPCIFPLGIKVVTFVDSESYTANQTEVFLKAGLTYHVQRFNFSVAALPAARLSNGITYRFYRDFSFPDRPDAEIDQRIKSGQTVDLAAIGGGPRSIQYEQRFNLQAEVAADYLITERLRLGLAIRPMLTQYDLSITNESFCSDVICVDYSGASEPIGSLAGSAALLQLSFSL